MTIPVTKPFLPPKDRYDALLQGIWDRQWLTNHGPMVTGLEEAIARRYQLPHFFFLCNGTVALQIAIKALELTGEVITTPFSYVATTSSIVWENCTPVFADIDPHTWNISPASIEEKISPRTSAIIATHVYGNPCDIEAIAAIAAKHNLKVIYDAAHAFGVTYKGESIFKYGDVATASFHATKLFHTIEGGGVFCTDRDIAHRLGYMRNFGHNGQEEFWGVGINGKNSEFHAAMGMANLEFIDEILAKRQANSAFYNDAFADLLSNGRLVQPSITPNTEYNYAYYPILFEGESVMMNVRDQLNAAGIVPRRYFYPSLAQLPYVKAQDVPVALEYSRRVLCLPSYHSITEQELQWVATHVRKALSA
jgi:dTDP-4-amino-4,6-dideoxygalactose transaminase